MSGPVHVVVVGDVMTDVVARIAGPVERGSDTAASIATHGGGSAANTAAWLASTGAQVTLLGRRGADPLGDAAELALQAAGVRTRLAIDPDRPTGTCIVVVEPGGERTMLPDRGANRALAPADIPAAELVAGRHLHLSGYPLLDGPSRPAALAALDAARRAGVTVSVDPSSAAPLRALGAGRFLDETGGWLCLPNLDEAEVLTGTRDPVAAGRALAAAYREVVVTLGADGAVWVGEGTVVRAPAAPAAGTAVDTTGAGDAFTAGFLAARLAGAPPSDALAAGAALAARAIAIPGGRPPAYPSP
ncbi:MAG: carbohydrate kinase family protein [Frankiaceae bacterium]